MSFSVSGRCLCGKIRFSIQGPFKSFFLCHCSRCRKSTGSAHAANIFTTPDRLTWIAGQDEIRRYEVPEAERFSKCFCPHCGSPVPAVSRDGRYLTIPAGALDEDPQIQPAAAIFWSNRAPWYEAGRAAPCFEGYPE